MSVATDRLVKRLRPELERAAAADNLAAALSHVDAAVRILAPFAEASKKARAVSRALPAKVSPGTSRPERRQIEERTEASGKMAARKRAEVDGSPRCEWFTNGVRCTGYGTDADHVLGGSHKKEMEALPNGEGFQVECRTHHQLKHGPGKAGHLAQAREHAIRVGSRGLLRLATKATALHNGKHPEARKVAPL